MKAKELLSLSRLFGPKTEEERAREGIMDLRKNLSAREGKYIRNMNRYMNNGVRREDLWTPYVWPQAYVLPAQNTDGVQTQFNVIKNCVDALSSKISEANVRPFFNSLNGDHDTEKSCKALQQHFDYWLAEQHAYEKSIMCFRDALTYDVGVMGIDPWRGSIDRVPPWEYFLNPAEYMHHATTHVMRWRKHFPLASLMDDIDTQDLKQLLARDPRIQGEYAEYYDLYNGKFWQFFDEFLVCEPKKLDFEKSDGLYRRPFVEMFYTKPMKGFFTVSLADDLYPIQREIDEIVRRFDNATRNMPLAIGFVPKGSGLKATNIGNAVTLYDVLSGGENGQVSFHTPSPLSQEWIQLLNLYIDKAYELSGISKMSAQSKKPADVEAAKALETLEDVESERFNVQLQSFTHFLVDVARVCIKTFPGKEPILPEKILRSDVTWGDAREDMEKYSVQFSAASVLSKDPDKKMGQITAMINGGFIDKAIAAHFLEIPDLDGVYTVESANYDAVQKIIEDAMEGTTSDYWETVDLGLLQSETVKKINMLIAVDDRTEYVKRLVVLLGKVANQIEQISQYLHPQAPPPPPQPLKEQAYDSGQIKGLVEMAGAVNTQSINPQQAMGIIMSAYPKLQPEAAKLIVSPQPPQGVAPGASPPGGMAPPPAMPGTPIAGGSNA